MNGNSSSEMVPAASEKLDWVSGIAWFISIGLMLVAGYIGWEKWLGIGEEIIPTLTEIVEVPRQIPTLHVEMQLESLPVYEERKPYASILRWALVYTEIPNRPRQDVVEHSVSLGDSVFGIALSYDLEPETVLWSNYDVLKDNPHSLSSGMVLKIPPTDGVLYKWQDDDTLESVAAAFETEVDSILNWLGNGFDLTAPEVEPESWVMIPGGKREFQQWIIPVQPRGAAGVSSGVYGGGVCSGGYDGLYGTGSFIWPTVNHYISGNDYWSGHLAIDIGSSLGEPISAADSGVVVFAGWATGGYGNTVAVDHGNGYQTLYAHLSNVVVGCGQSVVQGQTIGYGGSTGNSSGPHLHFEIRYQGGFVNPWYVLPAP
jgi:hypothetical protein